MNIYYMVWWLNHTTDWRGTTFYIKTPHCPGPSAPLAKRIYPLCPHEAPHEFLAFQYGVPFKDP
jgi:hypothetical protein